MKKIFFIGVICLLYSISVFSQSKKKWEQTQSLNSISVYQDFINKYPDGKYTEEAKRNLANLKDLEEKRLAKVKEDEERRNVEKQQKIKLAQEKIKNLKVGLTPQEVITLLSFNEYINPSKFGGLFIGIGLLPQKDKNECSYSGNAIMDGYYLGFKNGKATEWHIIENEVDSKQFHGEYDNGMTIGTWSTSGNSFNTGMKTK